MNEEHIIAAILAAGIVAQRSDERIGPRDAVDLYGECLTELLGTIRPPREAEAS